MSIPLWLTEVGLIADETHKAKEQLMRDIGRHSGDATFQVHAVVAADDLPADLVGCLQLRAPRNVSGIALPPELMTYTRILYLSNAIFRKLRGLSPIAAAVKEVTLWPWPLPLLT